MSEEEKELLTVKEAAVILNVSQQQVYRLIKAGKLPYLIIPPRTYRIHRTTLLRWIAGGIVKVNHDKAER